MKDHDAVDDNAVDDNAVDGMDAKAERTAHGLIQGYIGPDHKVMDMQKFYRALVQALKKARRP